MPTDTKKVRYDQWAKFHNPTSRDFVGKWDGEEYLIKAGDTQIFPVWLCRHFAKRLCDEEMIRKYKIPLRPGDAKRTAFIAQLAEVDLSDIDITPSKRRISMREQIETDREAHIEQQGAILEPAAPDEQIPVGDDEMPPDEPVKTETELAEEVAQENLTAGAPGGRNTLSRNTTGSGQDKVEFGGDLGNVRPVQPPQGGSGFASRLPGR